MSGRQSADTKSTEPLGNKRTTGGQIVCASVQSLNWGVMTPSCRLGDQVHQTCESKCGAKVWAGRFEHVVPADSDAWHVTCVSQCVGKPRARPEAELAKSLI